ncbi:MAG: HAD family hydrolase [archaeon]|mgnify:CR=1 FL=1
MSLTTIVKKNMGKAKVLGGFLRNSLIFRVKRQALRPRYWFNQISFVVVDMDGTLFDADAGNMGLRLAYPDKIDQLIMGDILYEGILHKLGNGTISVEEAILDGNRLLQYKNVHRNDFKRVLNQMWPKMRTDLVRALKELRREQNVHIILATLSSREFAGMVNKRLQREQGFSFDEVIGTQLKFDSNGKMTGVKEMLGLKNGSVRGIKIKTKLTALKELAKKNKWNFSMNQTVLITDSYGDIDMAKHVKTILLVPEKPTTLQAVSAKFRLADKLIPTDTQLKKNLLAVFETKK